MNLEGLKDWKTTVPFVVAAVASFIVNSPQYFPPVAVDLAKWMISLGLTMGGINALGSKKEK